MADLLLSLKDDVVMQSLDEGGLALQTPISRLELQQLSDGGRAVIEALASDGLTDPDMRALVMQHDGPGGLFGFFQLFPRLVGAGTICYTLRQDGEPLLMLQPVSPYFRRNKDDIPPDKFFQLSRFAFLHLEGDHYLLESPLGFGRLILHHDALLQVLAKLKAPSSWSQVAAAVDAISEETMQVVFQFLISIGAVTRMDAESGAAVEAGDDTLRQWDFHDLLFHSRTRYGRYDKPFDGTVNRFFGEIKMPPATKPPMTETPIDLFKPDFDALRANDPPLVTAMEERRTHYDYDDDNPITAQQVGEFLFRVGRVRAHYGEDYTDDNGYTEYMGYTNRVYPGGGAMYELELYLTVANCAGLDAGLYHYDADLHHLHQISEMSPMVGALIGDAAGTTPYGRPPQVIITLAARFPRMFWKYNTLGYALILKNVGVLYQSMYLAATAMQLAPVAMGAGNADLFAQAAGLDYYAETSVGEFSLSSRMAH
jgi:oxazoline/thiazoline dehydrogenase